MLPSSDREIDCWECIPAPIFPPILLSLISPPSCTHCPFFSLNIFIFPLPNELPGELTATVFPSLDIEVLLPKVSPDLSPLISPPI